MAEGRIPLQHAERFILSGKAEFVFWNTTTGNRQRFIVKEKSDSVFWVYAFPNTYLGYIKFREFKPTTQRTNLALTDKEKIFQYVWKHIIDMTLPNNIHVMHIGRCGVCGRPLTDPESIVIGIGPICLSRLKPH